MHAKLNEDRTEIETVGALPTSGKLPDGRLVSGFDKLDDKTIEEAGYIPATDPGPPEYDAETQRVTPKGWVISDGEAVREWVVEDIPKEELDQVADTQGRQEDARVGLGHISEIPGLRKKLRAVASGDETLTVPQTNKLLAGLALHILRDLDDV